MIAFSFGSRAGKLALHAVAAATKKRVSSGLPFLSSRVVVCSSNDEQEGDGGRRALQARQLERWASESQRARLLNSKKQQLIVIAD